MGSAWSADPVGATARVSRTVGAGHAGAHPSIRLAAEVADPVVLGVLSALWRRGGVVLAGLVVAQRSGLVTIRWSRAPAAVLGHAGLGARGGRSYPLPPSPSLAYARTWE